MDLKDQCTRIIQKYNNYHNLRFHWWYVLIAYGIGVFGWFAPGIMLDLRKKMVRAEEEEDVLQLQTMLAILRYTSLDTMEALYWLARQSRIYQTAIYFAYHEYPQIRSLRLTAFGTSRLSLSFSRSVSDCCLRSHRSRYGKRSLILNLRETRCSASAKWCRTIPSNGSGASALLSAERLLWLWCLGMFLCPSGYSDTTK